MSLFTLEHITKRFGGLKAVSDFSLTLEQGDIVGLIGPNGAGKTTIFNVITGVYPADSGKILFQNEDIKTLKPYNICLKGIGRTFQIVKPFLNRTILYNVMVGAFSRVRTKEEAEQEAIKTLEFTNLLPKKDVLAKNLTLPDRKRLEIARALATKPQLLLLDEVMAGLNPTEIDEAITLVRKMRAEKKISILIIEHVMQVIMSLSDRIIVLHHGEKIAEGTPEEVASNKQVIEAYLGEEYVTT
ncbi:ABC transporter, ATP-binding protein [Candidatus Vecturithrix granuli]|uniref:ABC transporter, ATP-binding protein n=1 Tax=Vecturithrix granuli TaxID=1499967 RepID=A0A081C7F6_VECG1|nr:ABC transporter, ATP-binding protein [Candidatus Vecturithrix granuli]